MSRKYLYPILYVLVAFFGTFLFRYLVFEFVSNMTLTIAPTDIYIRFLISLTGIITSGFFPIVIIVFFRKYKEFYIMAIVDLVFVFSLLFINLISLISVSYAGNYILLGLSLIFSVIGLVINILIILNKRYPKFIRYGLLVSWASVFIGTIFSIALPFMFLQLSYGFDIVQFFTIRSIVGAIATFVRTLFYAYILYYFFQEEELIKGVEMNYV